MDRSEYAGWPKRTEQAKLARELKNRWIMRYEAPESKQESNRKMRFQMHQLRNASDMENQPAYLRRNVSLDDVPSSKDHTMSRWTISNDDEPQIRENNSFLYDNVDWLMDESLLEKNDWLKKGGWEVAFLFLIQINRVCNDYNKHNFAEVFCHYFTIIFS